MIKKKKKKPSYPLQVLIEGGTRGQGHMYHKGQYGSRPRYCLVGLA